MAYGQIAPTCESVTQWRSQYRGKGAECPLDGEKIVKNREKEVKKRE